MATMSDVFVTSKQGGLHNVAKNREREEKGTEQTLSYKWREMDLG